MTIEGFNSIDRPTSMVNRVELRTEKFKCLYTFFSFFHYKIPEGYIISSGSKIGDEAQT